MPGPYAHITLLYELMNREQRKPVFKDSSGFQAALETYFPYCVLGAVSPDYPNLAPVESDAAQWADAMHYTRACEMIASGIRHLWSSQGTVRDKQIAWLLGYSAHVATDVTIHPVVQAKVGVYAENQRQHRVCEMNQDSYVYRRMNMGEIGESDSFAQSIVQCRNSDTGTCLDKDIVTLWHAMLADVHPDLFTANPPDCTSWHHEFNARVHAFQLEAVRLFPLAGVISEKMRLTYPSFTAVDKQFIENLAIPLDEPCYLHYDRIFEHAIDDVAAVWRQVEQAACDIGQEQKYLFGDWNLDNGCDECGKLVFWQ